MSVSEHVCVCLCTCTSMCIDVFTYVRTCVCTCLRGGVQVYVCMYLCTYGGHRRFKVVKPGFCPSRWGVWTSPLSPKVSRVVCFSWRDLQIVVLRSNNVLERVQSRYRDVRVFLNVVPNWRGSHFVLVSGVHGSRSTTKTLYGHETVGVQEEGRKAGGTLFSLSFLPRSTCLFPLVPSSPENEVWSHPLSLTRSWRD